TVLLRHAMWYSATGDAFDGREAARIGLINLAVPRKRLKAEVTKLAEKLMTKSPRALRASKQVARLIRSMGTPEAASYMQEKKVAIGAGNQALASQAGLHGFRAAKAYKPVYASFKEGQRRGGKRRAKR